MLQTGDSAPEIDAVATNGERFVLSQQGGLCTVAYFFPKAFTPGCTRETMAFRDNYNELALAGASVVGISTDDGTTQCLFAEAMDLPFPLIADRDGSIARAYDVLWPILRIAKRVTYVIAPNRLVLGVWRHELQVDHHNLKVLKLVNRLFHAQRQ